MGLSYADEGARELTTVAAVKARLRITDGSDDDLIDTLIKDATAEIERHCERRFAMATITETGLADRGGELVLSHTPVLSLRSVSRGGEPILSELEIDDAYAGIIRASSGIMAEGERLWWRDSFSSDRSNPDTYTVTYTGGWLTPAEADKQDEGGEPREGASPQLRTLPYDLEVAAVELVGMALTRPTPGKAPTSDQITSIKADDISYTYSKASATPGEVLDRLDKYRAAVVL